MKISQLLLAAAASAQDTDNNFGAGNRVFRHSQQVKKEVDKFNNFEMPFGEKTDKAVLDDICGAYFPGTTEYRYDHYETKSRGTWDIMCRGGDDRASFEHVYCYHSSDGKMTCETMKQGKNFYTQCELIKPALVGLGLFQTMMKTTLNITVGMNKSLEQK